MPSKRLGFDSVVPMPPWLPALRDRRRTNRST